MSLKNFFASSYPLPLPLCPRLVQVFNAETGKRVMAFYGPGGGLISKLAVSDGTVRVLEREMERDIIIDLERR